MSRGVVYLERFRAGKKEGEGGSHETTGEKKKTFSSLGGKTGVHTKDLESDAAGSETPRIRGGGQTGRKKKQAFCTTSMYTNKFEPADGGYFTSHEKGTGAKRKEGDGQTRRTEGGGEADLPAGTDTGKGNTGSPGAKLRKLQSSQNRQNHQRKRGLNSIEETGKGKSGERQSCYQREGTALCSKTREWE